MSKYTLEQKRQAIERALFTMRFYHSEQKRRLGRLLFPVKRARVEKLVNDLAESLPVMEELLHNEFAPRRKRGRPRKLPVDGEERKAYFREASRRWYANNKDAKIVQNRLYKDTHREELREYQRKYYAEHRGKKDEN